MSAGRRVLLGTTALVAVRLLLSAWRPGPVVLVDEVGYLTNARVLAGGVPADLLDTPFYHGGYSLLLAPLIALVDDPVAAYRLALGLNALLAAALFPLLYLLLTDAVGVPPRRAFWPALAAAAYPALTPTAGTAMSENLLFPLTAAWLLAFAKLLQAPGQRTQAGWAALSGLAAAALYAAHGRMVVAVAVCAAALAVLAARRRLRPLTVAAGGGALALGVLAARALDHHLIERNYGRRELDEAAARLSAIAGVDDVLAIAGNAVGQTWYLLVATLGLALAAPLLARRHGATVAALMAVLLAATAGLILVSAASFPDVARPDMLVYGRYVEVVAPPLVALGLVALPAARARPLVALVLAASVVVAALRTGLDAPAGASFWNVLSLPLRTDELGAASLLAGGVGAGAAAALLVWVARSRPHALGPLLLVLFVPTTVLAERALLQRSAAVYPDGWASLPGDLRGRIGYDRRHATFDGQFIYRWFATDATLASSNRDQPPGRLLISSGAWNRDHPTVAAHVVWRDPARDQTLWRVDPPLGEARLVERCLEAGGLAATPAGEQPRGAAAVSVGEARVVVFGSSVAASTYSGQVRRIVAAADRSRAPSVVRRANVMAIDPPGLSARERWSLVRCL
jgi:hypothetical protein